MRGTDSSGCAQRRVDTVDEVMTSFGPNPHPRASGSSLRLRSLDGLRGIAAAIVVIHHISMTLPSVSNAYGGAHPEPFSIAWWVVSSPLKILFAGPEFVLVFFVLSGFVLTLSPLGKRTAGERYDWLAYYPRRVLRLGIPVVAAMIFAVAVNTLLPHPVRPGMSDFLVRQASPPMGLWNIVSEALLLVNPGRPAIDPPMWSLTWEMWFSLLLPAAVLIAAWSRRSVILSVAILLTFAVLGYVRGIDALGYLPAFVLGAVLAANSDRINSFVVARSRLWAVNVGAAVLTVVGVLLMTSFWYLRPVLDASGQHVALSMRVAGAMLLVGVAAFWPAATALLTKRCVLWLGTISFSLYLVHSPLVVALGLIFAGQWWWVGALLSVAVSLAVAAVMHRCIEQPSLQFAQRFGRAAAARLRTGRRATAHDTH